MIRIAILLGLLALGAGAETWVQDGPNLRPATAAEIAQREVDQAAALDREAAEAEFAAIPLPDVTVPLMTGTNATGTARILVDAETLDILVVVDSASPQRAWTNQLADLLSTRDERRAVRDGFREEVEDSKTNRQSVVALSGEQAAGITNVQGLVFNASYNRAQIQALRAALVDDMKRQDKVITELRRTNGELIDTLRLLRRQMLDTRPEETP